MQKRECEKKYDQQMTHLFYMNPTFMSPDYRCLEPLFYKLNASVMVRVKANLTFCTEKNILTGWHTDVIESWGKEHKTKTAILNLSKIQNILDKYKNDIKSSLDLKILKEKKLINKKFLKLKILGSGEINKSLEISAHFASNQALSKIEKAGGKVIIIKK